MKKRSLHQLALNKKKISNLDSHSVNGGIIWKLTFTIVTRTIPGNITNETTSSSPSEEQNQN